jgi:streptogramin lyase
MFGCGADRYGAGIRVRLLLCSTAAVAVLVAPGIARAAIGDVTEYTLGISGNSTGEKAVTAGPDGNVWFTDFTAGMIGRLTTSTGTITEFPVAGAGADPYGIAAGPDGNLWFTETLGNRIGRITPTGAVTEFDIPTLDSGPHGITAGPDGNLWFVESNAAQVGKITTAGVITEYVTGIASGSYPWGITAGPDGNLWFTEADNDKIGRINPTTHTVTEFAGSPTPIASQSVPENITVGSDGNLWFTESAVDNIGRMTTSGGLTEYTVPTLGAMPWGIAAGHDGNLWFTEQGQGGGIGRITPTGTITEFRAANTPGFTLGQNPTGIADGPDHNIWFTEDFSFPGGVACAVSGVGTGPCPPNTPPPPPQRILSVALAGAGTGTVSGSGISCPGTCSKSYADGTVVTLTASAGDGSTFTGWSGGGCSGTGTCSVTMSADQSVTASFASNPPPPAAPKCTLKRKANPLVMSVRCDQSARATVTGTLTERLSKKKHKRFGLGPARKAVNAGVAVTVTLKLPKAALNGLKHHKKESAVVKLTATNANGTAHASVKISRIRAH